MYFTVETKRISSEICKLLNPGGWPMLQFQKDFKLKTGVYRNDGIRSQTVVYDKQANWYAWPGCLLYLREKGMLLDCALLRLPDERRGYQRQNRFPNRREALEYAQKVIKIINKPCSMLVQACDSVGLYEFMINEDGSIERR